MLTNHQIALARHHAYRLFSRLFLEGLTADLWPYVQQIGELTAVLPATFDADEAAATHQHLFGFNLFPYASIFLASDGLLGGDVSNQASQQYQQAGFAVDTAATSPDHIGHELQFLAYLCAAEADAWRDKLPLIAQRMQQLQVDFLQKHLLYWLIPLATAVSAQQEPLYSQITELAVQLVHDHATDLAQQQLSIPLSSYALPTPPDILAQEKTGLRRIARYLTIPPYSGLFLSRDHIGRLARQLDLPRGFGSREQLLENLLQTAVQYDLLPQLITLLQQTIKTWQATLQSHSTSFPTHITPWLKRLDNSHNMLQQIEKQATQ